MDVYNKAFESFAKLVTQLIHYMPSPSDFAREWDPIQGKDPTVLCLRPAHAIGLPLCTLHDVFLQFQREMSVLLPHDLVTAEAMAARIAASKLCLKMGSQFKTENDRGKAFDSCVAGLLGEMEKEVILSPKSFIHYGKVDRCIKECGIVIAIREDKVEPAKGDGDLYMQITGDYHFLVGVLTDEAETDLEAKEFLSNGAPCFLICVLGMDHCPLIFTIADSLLPRTHAVHLWWIL